MKALTIIIAICGLISGAMAQERKPVNKPQQDTVYYNKDGKIISQDSVKKNTPVQRQSDTTRRRTGAPKQNKSNAEIHTEQNPQQNRNQEIKKANSKEPHEMIRDTVTHGPKK